MIIGLQPSNKEYEYDLESLLIPALIFIICVILFITILYVCTYFRNKHSRDKEFANFDEKNNPKHLRKQRRCSMINMVLAYDEEDDECTEFSFPSLETDDLNSSYKLKKSASASELIQHEATDEEKKPSFITELQLI